MYKVSTDKLLKQVKAYNDTHQDTPMIVVKFLEPLVEHNINTKCVINDNGKLELNAIVTKYNLYLFVCYNLIQQHDFLKVFDWLCNHGGDFTVQYVYKLNDDFKYKE